MDDCKKICEVIENILNNTKKWEKYCKDIAINRRKNRIKGFLYAKVINIYKK